MEIPNRFFASSMFSFFRSRSSMLSRASWMALSSAILRSGPSSICFISFLSKTTGFISSMPSRRDASGRQPSSDFFSSTGTSAVHTSSSEQYSSVSVSITGGFLNRSSASISFSAAYSSAISSTENSFAMIPSPCSLLISHYNYRGIYCN